MKSPLHTAFVLKAFVVAVFSQLMAVSLTQAAPAPGSSPWVDNDAARVRLISQQTSITGSSVQLGVQIELSQGWKTYWRNPGDSGIPPNFDWSGSENLKSVTVRWPVPHRYDLSGEMTFAYKDEVIFPVEVTLSDPTKPLDVSLDFFYGICEEMCVPARAELSLTLRPSQKAEPSLFNAAIERAIARVPKAAKAVGLSVQALPMKQPVKAVMNGKGTVRYIEIRIKGKAAHRISQVVLEETGGTYFYQPVRIGGEGEMNCFQIAYEVARPKGHQGLPVRLTAWGEDGIAIFADLVLP